MKPHRVWHKPVHLFGLITLCFVIGLAVADGPYRGKVIAITDGDTLKILVDSKQLKIRLAEIDAPEKGQPWGHRSKDALARKVAGTTSEEGDRANSPERSPILRPACCSHQSLFWIEAMLTKF